MSRFISVLVKKLTDTRYARVTPYWMTNSVMEGNGGGTRKFWTTTPIMYASPRKKKLTATARATRFSLDPSRG